ncbi:hypothetical protein B0T10DRAFT_409428 [Thelonectria olida]|uniref:ferric-chelate reductase (NADPH) n=1 Tax=Thelonectria olida TaxID=1576542 RepID=A0A9P8W1J9_9HYPO|nr:hypothetical protein B0T10DRAFT_409428 [Thelonectria olida]
METSKIYGICMGGLLALLVFTSFLHSVAKIAHAKARMFFLRDLYYALLPSWSCSSYCASWHEILLFLGFIIANVCCVTIGLNDITEFTKRLGHAALINLVPLCSGVHMNRLIGRKTLAYKYYPRFHRWLGAVVIVEAALHSVLAAVRNGVDLNQSPYVAGVIVIIGSISILSLPVLWSWMYEVFSCIHSALAASLVTALWVHLGPFHFSHTPKIYLFIASLTLLCTKVLGFIRMLYFNVSLRGMSTALIQQTGAGVELRISLARPFDYRAGQFVYLNIPRLAVLELHPFQVSWAYLGDDGRQVIVLLVQPRHGFTRRLLLADPNMDYRVFVEGPYGGGIKIDKYGTVLLFATGIGIAGQLPYVKELLDLYRGWRANVRRIALFWELESEVHRYWIREYMDELLALDTDYILDIKLFICGQFLNKDATEETVLKRGQHGRIVLHYTPMKPESLINSEIQERKGRTLISICTDIQTTRVITRIVRFMLDKDIDMEELDFQPWAPKKAREQRVEGT